MDFTDNLISIRKKKIAALLLIFIFMLQVSFISIDAAQELTFTGDINASRYEILEENEEYSIQFDFLSGWDENFGFSLHDFKIFENYLFIQDYYRGFRVYDISDPTNPVFLTEFDYPFNTQCSGGPSLDFVVANDKIFISDYCTDLFVLDISDIYNPFVLYTNSDLNFYHFYVYNDYVFAYITGYQFSQYLVLDPTNSTGLDIVSIVSLPSDGWWGFTDFKDNLLYVHNYYGFELMIYNLTIIDQPVFISQTISSEYASVMGIAISNNYLVASLRNYDNHSGLSVYNISNPMNPYVLQNITVDDLPGLGNESRDITIKNDFCYLADIELGIQIIDLSNLSDVQLVETIDFVDVEVVRVYFSTIFALSTRFEIHAFDISDQFAIARISIINLGYSTGRVLFEDDYLFATSMYDGFYIFEFQPDYSLLPIYHFKDLHFKFHEILVSQNLLFLVTEESVLYIFDITTKSNPISLSNYTLQVNTYMDSNIYYKNNLLIVNSHFYDTWEIIDISNPATPVHLSLYQSPSYLDSFAGDLVVDPDRDLVYFATTTQLEIVNISDPANPKLLIDFAPTNLNWDHLFYENNTLFATETLYGLSVFDVTNPLAPKLLAHTNLTTPFWLNYNDDFVYVTCFGDFHTYIYHWQPSISGLTKVGALNQSWILSCSFKDDIVALARGTDGVEIYRHTITFTPTSTVKMSYSFGLIVIVFIINLYFLHSSVLLRLKKQKKR